MSYLLFEADDEAHFIEVIKEEVSCDFKAINKSSVYLIKKSSRRILKNVKKYIRYSQQTTTEIDLLVHFCFELGQFESLLTQSLVLRNMYRSQLRMIKKNLSKVHEDFYDDYQERLTQLELQANRF